MKYIFTRQFITIEAKNTKEAWELFEKELNSFVKEEVLQDEIDCWNVELK